MPFITNQVVHQEQSKKGPDKDDADLEVEAPEGHETRPRERELKNSSTLFIQMKKISSALERVRSQRCEILG